MSNKERPILFTGPMVRALLDGSKTQTRRAIKRPLQNPGWTSYRYFGPSENNPPCQSRAIECGPDYPDGKEDQVMCPYGTAGDRLWVREAWSHDAQSLEQCRTAHEDAMGGGSYGPYYRATESAPDTLRWKPSIHMPRWASRLTLEITSVRVESLQDISRADAIAEGAPPSHPSINQISREFGFADFSRSWYGQLWDQINGPGSWAANPWVWVIEFKVIEK